MSDVVSAFPLTIPGGGSVNNIFFVSAILGDSDVSKILLVFPPGCSGLVGVRVEVGGAQVYPQKVGTWFIFDNYPLEIPVSKKPNSGQWHIAGYNTDFYQHTIQAYIFWDYLTRSEVGQSSPLVSL